MTQQKTTSRGDTATISRCASVGTSKAFVPVLDEWMRAVRRRGAPTAPSTC